MMRKNNKPFSPTLRELRKFGVVVGAVFMLLGGWFCFRHRAIGPWMLTPGALLVLLGLLLPRALRGVHAVWMGLAFTLGRVVSTLGLTLVYYFVLTPIALFGRLCGKDFLSERLEPKTPSYWLARSQSDDGRPSHLEEQF